MSPEFGHKIQGVSTILLLVRDNVSVFCHRERKKSIAVYIPAPPVTHSNGSAATYRGGSSQ